MADQGLIRSKLWPSSAALTSEKSLSSTQTGWQLHIQIVICPILHNQLTVLVKSMK